MTRTLDELVVGDLVVIEDRLVRVAKVEAMTTTTITVAGIKFNRTTGLGPKPGDVWTQRTKIRPATEDDIKKAQERKHRANLLKPIIGMDWSLLPTWVLEEVSATLDRAKAEKAASLPSKQS